MNDYALLVDPTLPPGEVWVDPRGLRVEMTGDFIRLIPTGALPILIRVREAQAPLPCDGQASSAARPV